MFINKFATFLSNKSVLYLFSVIADSSVTVFGQYHLLRIICLYKLENVSKYWSETFLFLFTCISRPWLLMCEKIDEMRELVKWVSVWVMVHQKPLPPYSLRPRGFWFWPTTGPPRGAKTFFRKIPDFQGVIFSITLFWLKKSF